MIDPADDQKVEKFATLRRSLPGETPGEIVHYDPADVCLNWNGIEVVGLRALLPTVATCGTGTITVTLLSAGARFFGLRRHEIRRAARARKRRRGW